MAPGSFGERGFSSVLEGARRGDAAAIGVLYERYSAHVRAIVRRRLSPVLRAKYDTLDLAHSVFVEVIRELPRLEDRGERAFARLLAIKAENKVRHKLRRHVGPEARRVEVAMPVEPPGVTSATGETAAAREDERSKLRRALAALDETSRAVVHLHSEGRTFAEIAASLSLVSPEAARQRHARALLRLRRRWGP